MKFHIVSFSLHVICVGIIVPWFYGREIKHKINKLHERALKIVYNYTVSSFENLLTKDKSFTIHHHNFNH